MLFRTYPDYKVEQGCKIDRRTIQENQRKSVTCILNAVLYLVENGCKWRGLPKEYGDWHVICVRVNRWAKKGVLQSASLRLQQLGMIRIKVNVVSLDFTCIKAHPEGMGALKKERVSPSAEPGADGIPDFI